MYLCEETACALERTPHPSPLNAPPPLTLTR